MKAIVTNAGAIILASEIENEKLWIEQVVRNDGAYRIDTFILGAGLSNGSTVTLAPMKTESKAGPLPTSILSGAHHELSHIPSQRQAAKVASYYRELLAHHVSPEFAEQLTLEYQRMEMEND